MKEKKSVTKEIVTKYRKSGKNAKKLLLDEFVEITGYHRKYAIKLMRNRSKTQIVKIDKKTGACKIIIKAPKRNYAKYYDEPVQAMLRRIWEGFNYQCGKLLAPFLHTNIGVISANKSFEMADDVKKKLEIISSATIDRILKPTKQELKIRGTCGTKSSNKFKGLIPTLSHFECSSQRPGFFQIDLVQHDGGNASGEFCYTLTVTDVATEWTVHYALRNKAQRWVVESLEDARVSFPVPFWGIHSDSGSEFLNKSLYDWSIKNKIYFTKSRLGKKNDNCYVEQKNKSTVRDIIGYSRYATEQGVLALNAVYKSYDKLLDLFYPCMKIISKERIGSRYKKHYDMARTPMVRLLERADVSQENKALVIDLKTNSDLMDLKFLMDQAIENLFNSAETVPALKVPV
jgi:hypothetical protein